VPEACVTDAFGLGIRVALGIVFLASSLDKACRMPAFMLVLARQDVPTQFRRPVTIVVAAAEFAVGLGWLLTGGTALVTLATLALLAIFSGVVARALLHGQAEECGCGGILGSSHMGRHVLLRNSLLVAIAGIAHAGDRSIFALGNTSAQELAVVAAGTSGTLYVTYLLGALGDLSVLSAQLRAKVARLGMEQSS
jgi:hypothetical protein